MSEDSFFKKNAILLVGISLPLLLVIFFALARAIPAQIVDPPSHGVLYTVFRYDQRSDFDLRIDVHEQKLRARVFPIKGNSNYRTPRLYYFNPRDGRVEELTVETPSSDVTSATEVDVPSASGLELDSRQPSPEGYKFGRPKRRGGGVFGGLLLGNSYRSYISLHKDGATFRIPNTENNYNVHFVAWVVSDNRK